MTAFVFDDAALRQAVNSHEVEILGAIGIPWVSGGKLHILCPYPGHDDKNPSWRWDEKKNCAFCTCLRRERRKDSIFDVVMKVKGDSYPEAKVRIARLLDRTDLITTADKHDTHYYLNPPTDKRDDTLPRTYLAYRLSIAPKAVLMPTTRVAGWRALAYYDGSREHHIGDYPCAVFETRNHTGHFHGYRIYVAPDGRGKAELPARKNGARRDVKKALQKPKDDVDLPGHSVVWGDSMTAHTIILGEGIETCQALAQAHGDEIATGTITVAAALSESWMRSWQPPPATESVIIVADRDEGEDPHDKRYGIGQDAAETLAKKLVAAGKRVALAVPGEPGTDCDALDVWVANGASAVQALVAGAMPASECRSDELPSGDASEPPAGDASEPPAGGTRGLVLPHGFSLNDRGLWYQKREDSSEAETIWVCGALQVVAETCDDTHHSHGLLLRWTDRAGHEHTWAMPRRLVHADGNAIAAELEDAGLTCNTSRPAHERLKHFLGAVCAPRRVRCVDRAGWHGALYVLPDGRVFGADADSIVMQTEEVAKPGAYVARDALDEWRRCIASYAVGNDLLGLYISAAFAAPLLDVMGEPSGGVHIHGASQTGKTTLIRCAMSVYGPGEDKLMRSWRATANGLEAVASETSDGLLTLDEIALANPREVGEVIYTLANSAGKSRANRTGGARPQRTWRTLFLSTGEVTLAAKLSEAGSRVHAGQDVRMIGLSADAGACMGVWQDRHGFPSGAALSDHLRIAARTCCGTAGPVYLDQLARDRADDAEALASTLRAARDGFLARHVPANADGQVRSVATRFALVGAAGELATAYGVLPWPEGEAMRAAGACFARWLAARGGTDAAEDIQALEVVRSYIALHGSSRFEAVVRETETGEEIVELRTVINRAGWRRQNAQEQWEYLILPQIWRSEVCRGLDPGRVARVLAKRGMLVGCTGRHLADSVRIPGQDHRLRLYRVPGSILSEDTPDGE